MDRRVLLFKIIEGIYKNASSFEYNSSGGLEVYDKDKKLIQIDINLINKKLEEHSKDIQFKQTKQFKLEELKNLEQSKKLTDLVNFESKKFIASSKAIQEIDLILKEIELKERKNKPLGNIYWVDKDNQTVLLNKDKIEDLSILLGEKYKDRLRIKREVANIILSKTDINEIQNLDINKEWKLKQGT